MLRYFGHGVLPSTCQGTLRDAVVTTFVVTGGGIVGLDRLLHPTSPTRGSSQYDLM
jgi:hypothetical protein